MSPSIKRLDDGQVALVLGAAGFIDRYVCHVLNRRGYRVTGIGYGNWSSTDCTRWGLQSFLSADIGFDSLAQACVNNFPSVLMHCSGDASVARSYSDPLDDFSSSVGTTTTLLEFFHRRGNADNRIVIASSAAVYGDYDSTDRTKTIAARRSRHTACMRLLPRIYAKDTTDSSARRHRLSDFFRSTRKDCRNTFSGTY